MTARELGARIAQLLIGAARAGHEDDARAVTGSDEAVLCTGRAVNEVPGAQRPLVTFDQQRAFTGQDEEVLLLRFRVVEPARLSGPDHVHHQAELLEPDGSEVRAPVEN